jgi:hypothetical protein
VGWTHAPIKQTDKGIVADNLAHVPWLSANRNPHSDITNAAVLAGRAAPMTITS